MLEKREEEENRGGWARRRADSASSVEEGETGAVSGGCGGGRVGGVRV